MNYHLIKNKFEKVEYKFPYLFDIKIYYLYNNLCEINVKRIDSSDGWGLLLEVKIYDLIDEDKYEILKIGNSENNSKSNIFETSINLGINDDEKILIPDIIQPRRDISLINNNFKIINKSDNIDLHVVSYKLDKYKIKIIIRRLDEITGWDENLKFILYDNETTNIKELINIGTSKNNYKYIIKNTKIELFSDPEYNQDIPKIIIQTGYNNKFKNILHFNSIISFIELNPEYTYRYYNDTEARKFLRENFNEEVNYSYDILVPVAFIADLLRYCLLYVNGGCYFDCKQILRIPIRKFLKSNQTFLLCNDIIDNALLNAVIFSIKNLNFLEKTIKDCTFNIMNKLGKSALDITGPIFFYKSIKKFITKDNLLLQNNRPPDNFSDFSNDYYNNNITLISDNSVVLNRFYKGYYTNYIDNNHYGKLFINNEIYYKNFQSINNFKICVYPNKFNDKFTFILKPGKNIVVKRTDSSDGWNFDLKILIINNSTFEDNLINVGPSRYNRKEISIL